MKTTPTKKKSKNFYFTILEYIKLNYYPMQIATKLNISKQKLNYYISTLKAQGCIRKLSQGAWLYLKPYESKRVKKVNIGSLRQPPPKSLKILNDKNVRGHAFMFHLKLRNIRNWNNREKYFDKISLKYTKLKNQGQKLIVKGRIVHIFNKSIIIYDRESYISELARETKSLAIYNFMQIIKHIENKLKVSFEYKKRYQFKVTREHYALIKNCMAKQYNKEGRKLEVYNHLGLWLLIDNSFNLDEFEIIKNRDENQNKTIENSEGVQKYFNSHQDTDFKVTPEFVLDTMAGIQKNQLIFDNNMKSHLKVLDKIGVAVDELRREIKNKKDSGF